MKIVLVFILAFNLGFAFAWLGIAQAIKTGRRLESGGRMYVIRDVGPAD